MTTLTSQMNIRIDASLKQRGDAAFASMGYTTSEVVRAVWSLAASGSHGMDALRSILAKGTIAERKELSDRAMTDATATDEHKTSESLCEEEVVARLMPWELFDYYAAKLGDDYEVVPTSLSDDELLETALVERMRERGVWE